MKVAVMNTHISTAVAWREKITKHFVFYEYFCLILGLINSRISEKSIQGLGRKLDFKTFKDNKKKTTDIKFWAVLG